MSETAICLPIMHSPLFRYQQYLLLEVALCPVKTLHLSALLESGGGQETKLRLMREVEDVGLLRKLL